MKCLLCGLEFDEKNAQRACRGCPFVKSCSLVKCPNCGYESPIEPWFVKKIKEWRRKRR